MLTGVMYSASILLAIVFTVAPVVQPASDTHAAVAPLDRCCQEKPADAPKPPAIPGKDASAAKKIGKILGIATELSEASREEHNRLAGVVKTLRTFLRPLKSSPQVLKADSPNASAGTEVISFSQALYSVDFVKGIGWTPSASQQSWQSSTIAKIENGVTTPEALRHAAAAQHFTFGGGGHDCHGTALVFIQWDNANIADFLFRATVLDAFFSQFDSAAGLKPGTISSHIDTLIIWAGLASWSRRFAQLIVPKAEVVTRKQLEAASAARCWSNAFFFTENTPQVACPVVAPHSLLSVQQRTRYGLSC